MYLPVEPGRLIEWPVYRGPENRGCTVLEFAWLVQVEFGAGRVGSEIRNSLCG